MAREHTISMEVERNGKTLTVEVLGTVSPVIPGRYTGPPEDCYPDDGGEVEIVSVSWDGPEDAFDELTKEEQAKAEQLLFEAAKDYSEDACGDEW